MNNPHQNARTTRLGRAEMIRCILQEGQPVREVARGFGVSKRTARKWLARFKAEGLSGPPKYLPPPSSVMDVRDPRNVLKTTLHHEQETMNRK
jgi:transposase-like protein